MDKRTYGLIYTGFPNLISTALQFTLSVKKEAGTGSITPSLRYHHLVDRNASPAFLLTQVFGQYLDLFRYSLNTHYQPEVLLSYMSRLYNVYLCRKSHVTDYAHDGESIVQAVVNLLCEFHHMRVRGIKFRYINYNVNYIPSR